MGNTAWRGDMRQEGSGGRRPHLLGAHGARVGQVSKRDKTVLWSWRPMAQGFPKGLEISLLDTQAGKLMSECQVEQMGTGSGEGHPGEGDYTSLVI